MTPDLINWILLGIFLAEAVAIGIWRRDKYPRVFFNDWAIFIYSLLVIATLLFGVLLNIALLPDGVSTQQHRSTLIGLALLGGIVSAIVLGLTVFLRWAVRTNLSEPPR